MHSHPVINISAVSIIDRWISPLRCTKIIQTFLCWNWSINISPAGCLLKGWKGEKARCALLCFALLSHCAVEMKNMLLCLSPCSRHFPVLLCSSYPRIGLMHSMLSLFLSTSLSFPFLFFPSPLLFLSPPLPLPFFPLSLWVSCIHLKSSSFPGGENLFELLETTGSDLFIMVYSMCVFVVVLWLLVCV